MSMSNENTMHATLLAGLKAYLKLAFLKTTKDSSTTILWRNLFCACVVSYKGHLNKIILPM